MKTLLNVFLECSMLFSKKMSFTSCFFFNTDHGRESWRMVRTLSFSICRNHNYIMLPCYLSYICIICDILLCHIDPSEIKDMLCYVMLCYVMLCYVMLCYARCCAAMIFSSGSGCFIQDIIDFKFQFIILIVNRNACFILIL